MIHGIETNFIGWNLNLNCPSRTRFSGKHLSRFQAGRLNLQVIKLLRHHEAPAQSVPI